MKPLSILTIAVNELLRRRGVERQPEPDVIMEDKARVKAYVEGSRELGVMKPIYLFYAAQICDILRPGDRAIDLACGPASLLCMVAKMNPEVQFTGLDLSAEMLDFAREYAAQCGIRNVEFKLCDITSLDHLGDSSVDAVFSTMALHHLPGVQHLEGAFSEIARVVKEDGGLFLLDFGLLKTETAIREFAYQYADMQPESLTTDYYHSLHAAFPAGLYRQLTGKHLRGRASVFSSFPVPYNVAVKSEARNFGERTIVRSLAEYARRLTPYQRGDLQGLRISFRLGGLGSRLLDEALAESRHGENEPGVAGAVRVLEAVEN